MHMRLPTVSVSKVRSGATMELPPPAAHFLANSLVSHMLTQYTLRPHIAVAPGRMQVAAHAVRVAPIAATVSDHGLDLHPDINEVLLTPEVIEERVKEVARWASAPGRQTIFQQLLDAGRPDPTRSVRRQLAEDYAEMKPVIVGVS